MLEFVTVVLYDDLLRDINGVQYVYNAKGMNNLRYQTNCDACAFIPSHVAAMDVGEHTTSLFCHILCHTKHIRAPNQPEYFHSRGKEVRVHMAVV
jgi:hypothetical protein